jgi:hypothetical protein
VVAQLKFNSIPMTEIAGLDTYQLAFVYGRRRDKQGQLVRVGSEGLPDWVEVDADGMRVVSDPVPFGRMWGQVCHGRGWSKEATTRSWQEWLKANPEFERHANI